MPGNKRYIVPYITEDEIRCKCAACKDKPFRPLPPMGVPQLAFWQKVSNARHIRGVPMIFVSGDRCPQHPDSIINPGSAHGQLLAGDFYEKGIPIKETYRFWERVFFWNGLGFNEKGGTIHIDDKARYARWSYKRIFKQGRYIYKPVYLITCNI